MKMIRQGDVLLKRVDTLPNDVKEKDKILAYGEITGHTHRFESPNARVFVTSGGQQVVQVQEECELIHEEHGSILVSQGTFMVLVPREINLSGEIQKMVD